MVVLKDYLEEEHKNLDVILQRSDNSINELIQMMEYFLQVVQEFNAKALDEMQRYYPKHGGFTMSTAIILC